MKRANPRELVAVTLTEDNVDDYKRSDCINYDKCLSLSQKWEQFHCQRCKAYVKDPESERRVLLIGLKMKLSEALSP